MSQCQRLGRLALLAFSVYVPLTAGATVQDQLNSVIESLQGKRIGLVINPGSVDEKGRPDLDTFLQAKGTTITAFFAPEHGIRADVPYGEVIEDQVDPATGIPVYAIYRTRIAPSPEQLEKVDALVYDLTDVGVRFWTYTWSMTYCMEAAAAAGKPFYVIDRPNPVGGLLVEGMPNKEEGKLLGRIPQRSKIGLPTRHGMTLGEIAEWWNGEHMEPKVDLHVVRMKEWKRSDYYDQAGREFVKRSPNMRTLNTAIFYTGLGLIEGTNLSEGRGTTAPYEMIGAPFIDADAWCKAIQAKALPGVEFTPSQYTPTFSKFKNELCGGVHMTITDRAAFKPILTMLHMVKAAMELYPDKVEIIPFAVRLTGDAEIQTRLKNETPEAIIKYWNSELAPFLPIRAKYLMY